MYRIPVYKVQMVRDSSHPAADKFYASNPRAAVDIIRSYLEGVDREHFVVLLLNAKNQVVGIHTVSIGTLTAALVHPREVFKPAILGSAHAIIVAHNHPSGDPSPSQEDRDITVKLIEAGKILGIALLDHVIIGDEGRYTSFQERRLVEF